MADTHEHNGEDARPQSLPSGGPNNRMILEVTRGMRPAFFGGANGRIPPSIPIDCRAKTISRCGGLGAVVVEN